MVPNVLPSPSPDAHVPVLAREVRRKNILVNVVAPGVVETDMSAHLPKDQIVAVAQQAVAETKDRKALLNMGITFNVYGDSAGTERIFPFDLVPRIVAAAEWNWRPATKLEGILDEIAGHAEQHPEWLDLYPDIV